VRAEVEAAGFELDAESTLLANKDDPHSSRVFDPTIKGETDVSGRASHLDDVDQGGLISSVVSPSS